jgi:hypothetical protein
MGSSAAKRRQEGGCAMRTLLTSAHRVEFEAIVQAIDRFNSAGLNPFGPNVPVQSHSPLLLKLEGPGTSFEFQFYPKDRTAAVKAALAATPSFRTRHPVLYPMTRALIQRQWDRVYAYNVETASVTDVKLLVSRRNDPDLFRAHPKHPPILGFLP